MKSSVLRMFYTRGVMEELGVFVCVLAIIAIGIVCWPLAVLILILWLIFS